MQNFLKKWKEEHELRRQYGVPSRLPFYDLAGNYLPKDSESVVTDIGAGDGGFARYLRIPERYPNYMLLDGNTGSVASLKKEFMQAAHYVAPDKLPFQDASVAFIHLSHIVEHLYYEDLYVFLQELDRVLTLRGILVISTPLLWDRFYEDMSHVKPYNPKVFLNYLSGGQSNASSGSVSEAYKQKELVYRYRAVSTNEWGSRFFVVEAFIRFFRISISKLGFRQYVRNGYTLILEKGESPESK